MNLKTPRGQILENLLLFQAESKNKQLAAEKSELEEQLAKGDEAGREMETKARKIEAEKKELDKQV